MPVLKLEMTDAFEHTKLDITVQDSRHQGLKCVELVNKFLEYYPQIKSIILVLKQFLKNINKNDPYKGGLSSYALILMVVAYI